MMKRDVDVQQDVQQTVPQVVRAQYRAALKNDVTEAALEDAVSACRRKMEKEKQEGRLLTAQRAGKVSRTGPGSRSSGSRRWRRSCIRGRSFPEKHTGHTCTRSSGLTRRKTWRRGDGRKRRISGAAGSQCCTRRNCFPIPCAAAEAVTEALMLHPDWTYLQIAEELLSGENLADSDLTTGFPPA